MHHDCNAILFILVDYYQSNYESLLIKCKAFLLILLLQHILFDILQGGNNENNKLITIRCFQNVKPFIVC